MTENNNILYLDYNSTTPIDSSVLDEMLPYLKQNFANSSSSHHFGKEINKRVNESRERIADFINSDPSEIVFTSGATEAINIAIKGIAESYAHIGKHIITVSTEHQAVIDTCNDLEQKGFEVTFLSVNSNGLICLDDLEKSIRADTILVSVMYVNNETGLIQPIKKIASIVNEKGVLFMTDATQAMGKIDIDVIELGVDLLCFSGHKMYAPKGIGGLFVNRLNKKVNLTAQMHGGGHEIGLRSGTLNVPGIIALAKACEIAKKQNIENKQLIGNLRDILESELLKLPNTFVNGDLTKRIYNTSNICFRGQDANVLIGRMRNVAVSNGSACSSAIMKPSHVLKAMSLSDNESFASLRFSLGKYNTLNDVTETITRIKEIIKD